MKAQILKHIVFLLSCLVPFLVKISTSLLKNSCTKMAALRSHHINSSCATYLALIAGGLEFVGIDVILEHFSERGDLLVHASSFRECFEGDFEAFEDGDCPFGFVLFSTTVPFSDIGHIPCIQVSS